MHRYQRGAENAEREDTERKGVPREEGRKREGQRGNRGKRGIQRGRHAERKA
jgi:hypothetical protein